MPCGLRIRAFCALSLSLRAVRCPSQDLGHVCRPQGYPYMYRQKMKEHQNFAVISLHWPFFSSISLTVNPEADLFLPISISPWLHPMFIPAGEVKPFFRHPAPCKYRPDRKLASRIPMMHHCDGFCASAASGKLNRPPPTPPTAKQEKREEKKEVKEERKRGGVRRAAKT